jgi:hypothetical protein
MLSTHPRFPQEQRKMRRLIWSASVVLVAGAAWFYLAATYICNYPNSYLARCVEIAYRMGTEYNPFYRMSETLVVRVREGATPEPFTCNSSKKCSPSLEAITASACKLIPQVQIETATTAAADSAEESTSGVITVGGVVGAAEAVDDADGAPKTMPPITDDDAVADAPVTMPYIDEDSSAQEDAALYEYLKSVFRDIEDANVTEPNSEMPKEPEDGSEESESTHEGDSSYQMPPSHYSSNPSCSGMGGVTCPYTGKTYPADPKDDEPSAAPCTPSLSPSKKKTKKTPNKVGKADPGAVEKLLEKQKGTEDTPVHTEVDTMEYRRSDARRHEFDSQPE